MMRSRGENLAKNTLVIAFGTFLPKLASFVTLPIMTGLLTKEEYGTYDLVTVLASLLIPAVTLQVQAAAFRFLIEVRGDSVAQRKVVSNVYAVLVPVSIVCLVGLALILCRTLPLAVVMWICVYYAADALSNATRQVARGLGRNLDYSMSSIVASVGSLVTVVVLVWGCGMGLLGAVIALAVSAVASFTYLMVRLSLHNYILPPLVDFSLLREMLAYSWPLVPNELSNWVIRMSDRLVVTAFLGISANAVYAVANKIPQIVNMAQSTFTLAWQESASVASTDSDAAEYYSNMFRTMYALQGGFTELVVAISPLLFNLLVAGDYVEAYFQVPVLCLSIFFASMATFLGGIYVAKQSSKSVGFTTTAAAVVNIVIDIALVNQIGLWAASLSTLISYMLLFEYRRRDVCRLVDIHYDVRHMVLVDVLVICGCALAMMRQPMLNVTNIVFATASFIALNKKPLTSVLSALQNRLRCG